MKNIFQYITSKKALTILLVLATFTSCEKDLLEDELLSDTSVDFLYTNPEGLENAVVGLYTLNRNIYQDLSLNGTYPLIPQAKSDLGVGITGEVSL
ncbi:MAG: RagB/SusD family nutrient uptake outer membrane protein, partial [Bacteroidota bacterium]|nr:RagB/SusD family nutrient uptake outer membrane protein [Bacteroidota bacterium]